MIRLIKISAYALFAFLLPLWLFMYTEHNIEKEVRKTDAPCDTILISLNQVISSKSDTITINNSNQFSFPDSLKINIKSDTPNMVLKDIVKSFEKVNTSLDQLKIFLIADTALIAVKLNQIIDSLKSLNRLNSMNLELTNSLLGTVEKLKGATQFDIKLAKYSPVILSLLTLLTLFRK